MPELQRDKNVTSSSQVEDPNVSVIKVKESDTPSLQEYPCGYKQCTVVTASLGPRSPYFWVKGRSKIDHV